MQRTFSVIEARNLLYYNALPRPQTRFIMDFQTLLDWRDELVEKSVAIHPLDSIYRLNGCAIVIASQPIYIHDLTIFACGVHAQRLSNSLANGNGVSEHSNDDDLEEKAAFSYEEAGVYRPYFVLQNESGLLFSSLVRGVRDIKMDMTSHSFAVMKSMERCADFTLRMYHLPRGDKGKHLLECRLHSTLLLEKQLPNNDGTFEILLTLKNGDFDSVSASHRLPSDFTISLRYGRRKEDFPPEQSSSSEDDDDHQDEYSYPFDANQGGQQSWQTISEYPLKEAEYDGPSSVSFPFDEHVHSYHGDAFLEKIDVVRRVCQGRGELFLVAHVLLLEPSERQLFPIYQLFEFVLPEAIYFQLKEMGASQGVLDAIGSSRRLISGKNSLD